jgi:eukaryotic-like serine/threonine-protein kinase
MSESPTSFSSRPPTALVGQMAGEYRLGRLIGEGGFGTVFEAEHPVLKRRAAVKVLHRVAARDSDALLRFVSEAQAVNQIRSRHIVDIFSFGKLSDGRHFYVMDLLDGEPLDRALRRIVRFDVATALQILRPIAEALDVAHAAGIVHRDLKPQNVFLSWESTGDVVPKLLDFGVAKLLGDSPVKTVSGTPIGTPLYMSPEQARGDKVDARSDVYALGVLFHELITGKHPVTADSTLGVLMAHIVQPPTRASSDCPELPPGIDDPLLRMLEKSPDARPATAGAALADIASSAESTGIELRAGLPRFERPPANSLDDDGLGHESTLAERSHEGPISRHEGGDPLLHDHVSAAHRRDARWTWLGFGVVVGLLLLVVTLQLLRGPSAPSPAPAPMGAVSSPGAVAARPAASAAAVVARHAQPSPSTLSAQPASSSSPQPEPVSEATRAGLPDAGPASTADASAGKPSSKKRSREKRARAEDGIPSDLESPF